jgi:hypothetical protein
LKKEIFCKEIIAENKTVAEWAEIESDDMFQAGRYEGGFDATGMEFCFSVCIDDVEYWFELSLDTIYKINDKAITAIEVVNSDQY